MYSATEETVRCFDRDTSSSWSPQLEYNVVFLKSVQQYMNDLLHVRGHVLLNDVFDSLGLNRTTEGCLVGWTRDSGSVIDFTVEDNGDNELILRFRHEGVVIHKVG